MNNAIRINKNSVVNGTVNGLPSSKSVSNRALVLNALSGGKSRLSNLSEARDTVLMNKLIQSTEKTINVMDAGTTMRFLTAYFAVTNQNKILTGTDRMKERPIFPLVNALREIGAEINYREKEGFPPFEIKGISHQKADLVKVPGNMSSQFISALMLAGSKLPKGLTIELIGEIGSRPYITMTEKLIKVFGGKVDFTGNQVIVQPGSLKAVSYTIEPDWSAASYWFGFCALANESELLLKGNFTASTQGDQVMAELGNKLGVHAEVIDGYLRLTKTKIQKALEWNFTDCPDLAQTVFPMCVILGIQGIFTGLESLRIKETDRIHALQVELGKLGATIEEVKKGVWKLTPPMHYDKTRDYSFTCYHDHRMAMGLAPIATQVDIEFDDRTVVNKSYPRYWEDLSACGFQVN